MAAAVAVQSPVVNGKYALLRVIGVGGAATVYEAENLLVGRRVALKLLAGELAKDPAVSASFIAEARVAARIAHPNVADILDVGIERVGRPYIVMELLDGETLERILDLRGPLPVPYACELMLQVLSAVAAAHKVGIIHRDLKPANVIVTHPEPDRPRVKVLDFGIAQGLIDGDAPELEALRWAGTPAYMSPEQALGSEVDGRADVFSACAMLYELLTGFVAFEGKTFEQILAATMRGRFVPLRERNPLVPEALAATVEAGLVAQPALRIASATELAERLMPFVGSGRVPRFASGDGPSIVPIPLVRRDTPPSILFFETDIPALPLAAADVEATSDEPEPFRKLRSNKLVAAYATLIGFAAGIGGAWMCGYL